MAFEWSPSKIIEKIGEPFVELGKGINSIFASPAKGTVGPSDADRKSAAIKLEAGARGLLARKSFRETTSSIQYYAIRARAWVMPYIKRAHALSEQTLSEMAQGGAFEKQTMRGYGNALIGAGKQAGNHAQALLNVAKDVAVERATPAAEDLSAACLLLNLTSVGLAALTSLLVCFAEVAGEADEALGALLVLVLRLALFGALYYLSYFLFLLPVPRRAAWLQACLGALCLVSVLCILLGGWSWALLSVSNLLLAGVGALIYKESTLVEPRPYQPLVAAAAHDPKAIARSVEPTASLPTVQRIYAPCKYP